MKKQFMLLMKKWKVEIMKKSVKQRKMEGGLSFWAQRVGFEFRVGLVATPSRLVSSQVFCLLCFIAWPLLLVALSSSVGNLVVLDLVRSLWWIMGYTAGKNPATCRTCGKTFPRP